MVDFRRCITALAALALFAGLAAAQVGGSGGQQSLSCATNVSVTPTLRAEGFTEQTGDITLTCTGGSAIAAGAAIPTVNIQIFLNANITSRLLPVTNVSSNVSEALLLIDEPGSGLGAPVPNFGPAAPQNLCQNPTGNPGCPEVAQLATTTAAFGSVQTLVATDAVGTSAAAPVAGRNVFQGIVSANGTSVTWLGVPILAPVTTGLSRVLRFTNIRANATQLGGGSAAGATPVIASISISGATSLLISNPTPTVGFVSAGLSTSQKGAASLAQCKSFTTSTVNLLTFSENFATAFKTRVQPLANTTNAGQSNNTPGQNVPGNIYNSESNFILPAISGTAGLADFGTRLKATFNTVPVGVRLFVSVNNVVNGTVNVAAAPSPVGGTSQTTYAQLVSSETAFDTVGFLPSVPGTAVSSTNPVLIAEIPVVNGSATAVWEIVNTNPSAQESAVFAVYATGVTNVAQNSPPAGSATVSLSFAPTPPSFTATAGVLPSNTLTVPRFISASAAAANLFTINICRTILLYPFITSQGFDTGVAIANTSTDPFGTGPQNGSCQLNWYGGAASPAPTSSGNIVSGAVYTTLASLTVPNFTGYMIAVCQFQFAHGFAFISDLGAQKLAMGYLALVVPDPTTQNNGVRNASTSGCGVGDVNCGGGEGDNH